MAEDHQKLVSCFLRVDAITDPDNAEYRRRLELNDGSEAYRRAKADSRKNKIKFEALVHRIVSYLEKNSEDIRPSTFIDCLSILSSIVQRSIASYKMTDVQLVGQEAVETARVEMEQMQDKMSLSGAAALCVHLFKSKRDAIACSAMELAINMLEVRGRVRGWDVCKLQKSCMLIRARMICESVCERLREIERLPSILFPHLAFPHVHSLVRLRSVSGRQCTSARGYVRGACALARCDQVN